jgi:hypothetical protein
VSPQKPPNADFPPRKCMFLPREGTQSFQKELLLKQLADSRQVLHLRIPSCSGCHGVLEHLRARREDALVIGPRFRSSALQEPHSLGPAGRDAARRSLARAQSPVWPLPVPARSDGHLPCAAPPANDGRSTIYHPAARLVSQTVIHFYPSGSMTCTGACIS